MIKHNKGRNVGIIFEVITKSILNSIAENETYKASRLFNRLQKFFISEDTEIKKMYKLYSQLTYTNSRNHIYASKLLEHLIREARSINEDKLNSEINYLRDSLRIIEPLKEIFKTKIPNYKLYASFKTLIDIDKLNESISPVDIVNCEEKLIEHLLKNKELDCYDYKNNILNREDLIENDLSLVIALKKFRSRYSKEGLNEDQINCLINYLHSPDQKTFGRWAEKKVKKMVDEINGIKERNFTGVNGDKFKLKIETVIDKLQSIDYSSKLTSENIEDLILAFELKKNLNSF